MKRSGTDDFWELSDSSKYLPKETREYVPLILAAIIVAKNPVQYGFDIVAARPDRLRQGARCRARSTCAASPSGPATSIDEIQALNPELRRWTTPIKYPGLRSEGADRHRPACSRRSSPRRPVGLLAALKWYTVRRTAKPCATIARKLQVSRVDLARGEQPHRSSPASAPGQELIIPRAPATLLAARTERAVPDRGRLALARAAPPPSQRRAGRRDQIVYRSSAATRSSRSPGCSTPPSRTSRAGTSCAATRWPSAPA